jgi:hypothetical protein
MKKFTTILLCSLFVLSLSGCSNMSAENAGEELDELAQDAGNAIEDACENVKEGVDAEDQDC